MTNKIQIFCEYQSAPLGIQNSNPRFSWRINDTTAGMQRAYRLTVFTEDGNMYWDSGEVQSCRSVCVTYEGPLLKEKTRYNWHVTVTDVNGIQYVSESSWFETAIFKEKTWRGQWIGEASHTYGQSPRFRREFTLSEDTNRARLYISGLGYYIAYLNGKRIGDRQLEPGMTDYRYRVLYSVYDVTDLLKKGKNVLAVELGEGWYGHQHECIQRFMGHQPLWNNTPKLRYDLDILSNDNKEINICSMADADRYGLGPIIENSIYDGEKYDASLDVPDWNIGEEPNGFSPSVAVEAPTGKMVAQQCPPIKIAEKFLPQLITKIDKNHTLYDFGQNISGWVHMRCTGARGSSITFKYSEVATDNRADQRNLRSAKSADTYILSGNGEEEYQTRFTYHGFRFVEAVVEGDVNVDFIEAQMVCSEVKVSGCFSCDNKVISDTQTAMIWTERDNMHSIPTDCPQRDERQAWLNDVTARCSAALYNFDILPFYEKWLDDILDAQDESGAIPDTAPMVYGMRPAVHVSSVFILLPLLLYRQYGDYTIMKRLYPAMKKYLERKAADRGEDGLLGGLYYGEWAPPASECMDDGAWSATPANIPPGLVATSFIYADCNWMKEIATILGYTDDIPEYERIADEVYNAVNSKYLKDGYYDKGVQTSQIVPLCFEMVPEQDIESTFSTLIKDLEKRNYLLTTGNQASKLLFDVLSRYGRNDIAFRVATATEYPSLGYMLKNDATTLWERWEYLIGDGMNSHNHPMLGSYSFWFYSDIGGIRRDECLCDSEIKISPDITLPITSAQASTLCGKGQIKTAWQKSENRVELQISVPWNTEAVLSLPRFASTTQGWQFASDCTQKRLSSGEYKLVFDGANFIDEAL